MGRIFDLGFLIVLAIMDSFLLFFAWISVLHAQSTDICQYNFTATISYTYRDYVNRFSQTDQQKLAQYAMSDIITDMMNETSKNCSIPNYTEYHTFDNSSDAKVEISICANCNLTEKALTQNLITVTYKPFEFERDHDPGITIIADTDDVQLITEYIRAPDGKVQESTTSTTEIITSTETRNTANNSLVKNDNAQNNVDNDDYVFWIVMLAFFALICISCAIFVIIIITRVKKDTLMDSKGTSIDLVPGVSVESMMDTNNGTKTFHPNMKTTDEPQESTQKKMDKGDDNDEFVVDDDTDITPDGDTKSGHEPTKGNSANDTAFV